MSSHVSTLNYELPYREILGGVTGIRRKHFELINGFSNRYFGWGIRIFDLVELAEFITYCFFVFLKVVKVNLNNFFSV